MIAIKGLYKNKTQCFEVEWVYAFDKWMERNFPVIPFCRYADDALAHCQHKEEAETLKHALETRLRECSLEMHPKKTKIVYCKDDGRR